MGEPLECEGSARDAVSGMPSEVRMVFSGFEVGFAVNSGGALTSCATSANPCRQAYVDYVGEGKDRSGPVQVFVEAYKSLTSGVAGIL